MMRAHCCAVANSDAIGSQGTRSEKNVICAFCPKLGESPSKLLPIFYFPLLDNFSKSTYILICDDEITKTAFHLFHYPAMPKIYEILNKPPPPANTLLPLPPAMDPICDFLLKIHNFKQSPTNLLVGHLIKEVNLKKLQAHLKELSLFKVI